MPTLLLRCLLLGMVTVCGLSLSAVAAESRSEVAAGLVPYAGWMGRLPADDGNAWELRRSLAFYRGRLGVWMEAELPASSTRLPVARQFDLRVTLARAARFNGEWDRARGWITSADELLARLSEEERSSSRLAGYFDEAVALRHVKDVRVAYTALKVALDGELPMGDRFDLYRRLVDMAVITDDRENYSKLATAMLTTARDWNHEEPAVSDEYSAADQAMNAWVISMLRRGHAATVLSILDVGISDPGLRRHLTDQANFARVAGEPEPVILAYFENQTSARERLELLACAESSCAGLASALAHVGRDDLVRELLARTRDESLVELTGGERTWWHETWNRTVRRTAGVYLRLGRRDAAGRLGDLYVEPRRLNAGDRTPGNAATVEERVRSGALMDRSDGLVAFATLLGGETGRRLLSRLPFDYPRQETFPDASPGERAMREQAAEAVRSLQQAALVTAWAAAGETRRALEVMDEMPTETRLRGGALRQRLLAELAAAAAIEGEDRRAFQWIEDSRLARPGELQRADDVAVALVAACVLSGRKTEAWDEIQSSGPSGSTIVAIVVESVIFRGRTNRVIDWLRDAPEAYRREAWRIFFQVAVPDPVVPPVAPE